MPQKGVAQLVDELVPDPGRKRVPFSPEMAQYNASLLDPTKSDSDVARDLRQWLRSYQPCLFGRVAAGESDLLSFCILAERDLIDGDRRIRDKIQEYRLQWKRDALRGDKSGFIILAASPRIVDATPNMKLKALAIRLTELYLREEVSADQIYLERVALRVGTHARQWRVGVNFFSTQGDRRWWLDHRAPGGILLSTNSVGHMAKSGALANRATEFDNVAGLKRAPLRMRKVDSLRAALKYAMMTINRAQDSPSGKATWLRSLSRERYESLNPRCPIPEGMMPEEIRLKDYTTYFGWYHTDVTIPGSYFLPAVDRPTEVEKLDLDFTYLFNADVDNPAFETMGAGERAE